MITNLDFVIRIAVGVLGFATYIFTLRKALGQGVLKDNLFWLFLGYLLILDSIF